jgi:hypothetical protein
MMNKTIDPICPRTIQAFLSYFISVFWASYDKIRYHRPDYSPLHILRNNS